MDLGECLELIHQYCPIKGTVMDLFAGTMVTGMAAIRLNRTVLLVEIDKHCADVALARLRSYYRWCHMLGVLVTAANDHDPAPICALEVSLFKSKKACMQDFATVVDETPRSYPLGVRPKAMPATVDVDAALIGKANIYNILGCNIVSVC
jgi:hypothetical protein